MRSVLWESGKKFCIFPLVFLITFLHACSGNSETRNKTSGVVINTTDNINSAYIRAKAFQNSDSTWGFTVFVNSRPYLHYKKMPFDKSNSGFHSKKDADKIASVFVKMLLNGDPTPELSDSEIDSLKALEKKN